jgi:hypothetical protein
MVNHFKYLNNNPNGKPIKIAINIKYLNTSKLLIKYYLIDPTSLSIVHTPMAINKIIKNMSTG